MLIPLAYLEQKYDLQGRNGGAGVRGVLHVGAHLGQEAELYNQMGFQPVYWVEADPTIFVKLRHRLSEWAWHYPVNALLADRPGRVQFNRAINEQSSSLLELGTHALEHPDVTYTGSIALDATTLDALLAGGVIPSCNYVSLDVQGAELLVLKGGLHYLQQVAYVYCEVNCRSLYKDCVLLPELDEWMLRKGFTRREIEMTRHGWGDAFYVRTIMQND